MPAHGGIERLLSGMAEGRMSDVMNQRQRLDQIAVQPELGRNGTRNLRHFDGVRQAIAKMIGLATGENLGLGFQAPEGTGMNDAVAIALKIVAVGVRGLGMAASERHFSTDSIRSQHSTQY